MASFSLTQGQRAATAWIALVALVVSLAGTSWAVELRPTEDFADVVAAVEQHAERYGANRIVLVLDIDNTIMSMDTDLGSDHWFEWQSYLLEHEPNSPDLVADDFAGLLDAQGMIYNLGHMHPPDLRQPEMIAGLQDKGVATIILTSRGPEYRVATERELNRCGYDIAATALRVDVPGGTYLPYNRFKPERSGITSDELRTFKLDTDPRPVSYQNGVFMTAGQHKGIMLLTLLHQTDRDIEAVVYVDDNVRHVGNVFSAAVDRDLDISSFHYQREDDRVKRFQYGDKDDVTHRWKKLRGAIHSVFEEPALVE